MTLDPNIFCTFNPNDTTVTLPPPTYWPTTTTTTTSYETNESTTIGSNVSFDLFDLILILILESSVEFD